MISAITNVWGLEVIYDVENDQLSLQGVCGQAAMYSVRIIFDQDEREDFIQGRMDFADLQRRLCKEETHVRHVEPVIKTSEDCSLDDLRARLRSMKSALNNP